MACENRQNLPDLFLPIKPFDVFKISISDVFDVTSVNS